MIVGEDIGGEGYVNYICQKCGQLGTARFHSDDMSIDDNDDIVPDKVIFCCECKSTDITIEDVECYS